MTSVPYPRMPTPAGTVYRIQRRHAIHYAPTDEGFATDVMGQMLALPTTHIWSLTLADGDGERPHIVLFHDAKNAHAMVHALRSFERKEARTPTHYNDLRAVFATHFMPSYTSSEGENDELHVTDVEFEEAASWASMRRIGVLAIATIELNGEGNFQVPVTVMTPNEDQEVDDRRAFAEDFEWQVRDLFK